MRNLDKEQFEEGLIRINCYDSSVVPFVGNTMIGAYAIDASMVYTMNKDHEVVLPSVTTTYTYYCYYCY